MYNHGHEEIREVTIRTYWDRHYVVLCGVRYAHARFRMWCYGGKEGVTDGRSKTELVKGCDTAVHEVSPHNFLFLIHTNLPRHLPLLFLRSPLHIYVCPESKAMS
jgi:hypothetical protein